jgi:hypothetical protein
VEVVAIGNFAQRPALAGTRKHRTTVERVPAMNPLTKAPRKRRNTSPKYS